MLNKIIAALAFVLLPAFAQPALASFTGTDYSGHYTCKGNDSHIGEFTGKVEMKLDTEQSTGEHGAYRFKLTLADNSEYDGFAAANSNSLAIYFAHKDPTLKDYGVGIAPIKTDAEGKISFSKYYYAPEYQGGGHGTEVCVKS